MSRQRFALLLLAALAVIACGLYFAAQRNRTQESPGMALLPAFDAAANTVTALMLRKGSAAPAVTVHKIGDRWTVAERADYPADVGKIRTLLLALRDARIIEEKTSDPARFADIGVADPSGEGAVGAEVTVIGPKIKLAVIVGKAVGDGNFVRRAGENQTYSVEPAINVEAQPKEWIDSRLLDVPVALIQSVDIKPAEGAAYGLHRLTPADASYALDPVPPGRKALDAHALAPGPTTFSGLTAEDVSPGSDIDFGHASQATVTLTDGSSIALTGTVIANRHWIEVKAKDAALTAKTQGRAFEIASYRYDAIFKPVEQLLVPKEPPAAPAGKPAPAAHAAKTPAPATPP